MGDILGSLPDWLSIAIGVLSLGGGAGVGVFRGGVARARLEDRRELVKVWLPWVSNYLFSDYRPGHENPFPVPPAQPDHVDDYLSSLRWQAISGLQDVTDQVELLPWVDRALWRQYLNATVDLAGANSFVLPNRAHGPALGAALAANAQFRLDHAMPVGLDRNALKDPRWFALKKKRQVAGDRLRKHLRRHVNPTWAGRWASNTEFWRLIVFGPRPWSDSVRLDGYADERHLRRCHVALPPDLYKHGGFLSVADLYAPSATDSTTGT